MPHLHDSQDKKKKNIPIRYSSSNEPDNEVRVPPDERRVEAGGHHPRQRRRSGGAEYAHGKVPKANLERMTGWVWGWWA